MTIPTRLRQRDILTAQLASCQGCDSSFSRGAAAALCWLTACGPGPLAGAAAAPIGFGAIVHELAAAEAIIYGVDRHRAGVRPWRRARPAVGRVRHVCTAHLRRGPRPVRQQRPTVEIRESRRRPGCWFRALHPGRRGHPGAGRWPGHQSPARE
jgi:hypothetical protein